MRGRCLEGRVAIHSTRTHAETLTAFSTAHQARRAMSEVIRQLCRDHQNVVRLLEVLEGRLNATGNVRRIDIQIMADVMEYMTHYPDRHHHPAEDLVFERLLERDVSTRSAVSELTREHQALADKGTKFLASLQRILKGEVILRDTVTKQGRLYIDLLRGHMRKEESGAFVRATQALDTTDWDNIERRKSAMEDPLFGPVVDKRYRDLFEYLTQRTD